MTTNNAISRCAAARCSEGELYTVVKATYTANKDSCCKQLLSYFTNSCFTASNAPAFFELYHQVQESTDCNHPALMKISSLLSYLKFLPVVPCAMFAGTESGKMLPDEIISQYPLSEFADDTPIGVDCAPPASIDENQISRIEELFYRICQGEYHALGCAKELLNMTYNDSVTDTTASVLVDELFLRLGETNNYLKEHIEVFMTSGSSEEQATVFLWLIAVLVKDFNDPDEVVGEADYSKAIVPAPWTPIALNKVVSAIPIFVNGDPEGECMNDLLPIWDHMVSTSAPTEVPPPIEVAVARKPAAKASARGSRPTGPAGVGRNTASTPIASATSSTIVSARTRSAKTPDPDAAETAMRRRFKLDAYQKWGVLSKEEREIYNEPNAEGQKGFVRYQAESIIADMKKPRDEIPLETNNTNKPVKAVTGPMLDISSGALNILFMGKSVTTPIIEDEACSVIAKSITHEKFYADMVKFNKLKTIFELRTLEPKLWSAEGKIVITVKSNKTTQAQSAYHLVDDRKPQAKNFTSKWVSYPFDDLLEYQPCSLVTDEWIGAEDKHEYKTMFMENVLYTAIVRWLFGYAGLTWDNIFVGKDEDMHVTSFWETTLSNDSECFKSLMTKQYIHKICDNLVPAVNRITKIIAQHNDEIVATLEEGADVKTKRSLVSQYESKVKSMREIFHDEVKRKLESLNSEDPTKVAEKLAVLKASLKLE